MSTPYGAMPAPQTPGEPPASNLVWGILVTIFCCLPLGIVSIVYAAQVNSKWAQGDAAGAQDSSRRARQFALWGAIIGVVVGVLYGVLVALGAAAGFDA